MSNPLGWISHRTQPAGLKASEFFALACAASAPILWIFSMAMLQSSSGEFPYHLQAAFCFSSGGGLLALAALGRRRPLRSWPVAADIATMCVLVWSAMTVPFVSSLAPGAIYIAIIAGGLGLAWLVVRCFAACCFYGIVSGYRLVLMGFAIAALLRLLFGLVPVWSSGAIAALLAAAPPCALMIIRWLESTSPQQDLPASQNPSSMQPLLGGQHLPFIVELLVCALLLGVFMGAVGSSGSMVETAANHLMRVFVALLLLALFDARIGRRSYRPVRAMLIAGVIAACAVSLLGGSAVALTVGRATFSLARNFALLVAYLLALHAVFSNQIAPIVAIGVFRGLYDVAQGIGVLLNLGFSITSLPVFTEPTAIPLISAIILLLTANRLIIFATRTLGTTGDSLHAELMAQSCAAVGARFGLTARETQLLELMCNDASKAQMAEALCVSVNTVRWHCQHIYEKLGVHSKREAADLVEAECSG